MSIKSALIGLLLFVGSVICAYLLQVKLGGDVYSTRTPASDDAIHLKGVNKHEVLNGKSAPEHVHTEKLRGPLSVTFEAPKSDRAPEAGDVMRLTAHLASEANLGSVRVRWSLPSGVELVSGAVEEVVSIPAGAGLSISVEVRLLTGDNHQIHIHADSTDSGMAFGEVAQYNTVFEGMLQADAESKAEALQKLNAGDDGVGPAFKVFE